MSPDRKFQTRREAREAMSNETPNVTIENPKTRRIVRTVLDTIGGLTVIASAADVASSAFDISEFTVPVLAAYAMARVVFGFAVDSPNTPK